ncbi:6,7-dimethyl-8-ribityllumazine synthase [Caulobacter sp. KR2-114]|uniref:6,7-dimethyl-8-ribityllumazine synthase n=1 Tax=Caulobacter sp. KR2-114 TaxID=3400912 RepID=UPI003C09F65F
MLEEPPRILIVEARSLDRLSDELLRGAQSALDAFGAEHSLLAAPSAFEIPAVIAMAEEHGHRPAGVRYDGYVALGAIIRGETFQFEVHAQETARGLMDLAIGRRLAIGNGVLITDDEAQALARAHTSEGDRGGWAAKACLDMVVIRRQLLGQVR